MFFSSLDLLRTLEIRGGLRYFKFIDRILGIEKLLSPQFLKKFQKRILNFGYQGDLGDRIKKDVTTWTLPLILRHEDKSSMAHSIETRSPFLDHRLIEKMASFSLDQKMKNGWTKAILRDAMKGIVPEKIVKRKSKLGFEAPEESWLKNSLKQEVQSTIEKANFIRNYVNKDKLSGEFEKFLSGRNILSSDLFFRFYILELWGQKFFL